MRSTMSRSPAELEDVAPSRNDRTSTTSHSGLSLPRLYLLRFGYLVVAAGLVVTKWPLLLNHPAHWPLMDGVETSMLVAMSLLFILGLRYPVRMLPILLFESLWKLIWVSVVAAPLWAAGQMDSATWKVVGACAVVLIVVAVIPWRYVVTHYVTKHGDPWRSTRPRPISGRP